MMAGARAAWRTTSTATPTTPLLAALPLSFDARAVAAHHRLPGRCRVVLLNWLLPRDDAQGDQARTRQRADRDCRRRGSIAQMPGPTGADEHLRYIANTGGRMPGEVLARLRAVADRPALPDVRPHGGLPRPICPEGSTADPTRLAKPSPMPRCWCCAPDGSECAPTGRASWYSVARWWRWATGTIQAQPPAPARARRRAGREPGLVLPDRGVLRRYRAPRRGRLPLLHRPPRRDDQDLGLPRQPTGSKDPLRHRPGRRMRRLRRRARHPRPEHRRGRHPPAGAPRTSPRCWRVPRPHADLHGAGALRGRAALPPHNASSKIDRKALADALASGEPA